VVPRYLAPSRELEKVYDRSNQDRLPQGLEPVPVCRHLQGENMGPVGRRGPPKSLETGPGDTAGGNGGGVVIVLFESLALGCLAQT